MPGMSLDQPMPCPECNGSGISQYANGIGGQPQQCHKCHGDGEVMGCAKCGAGPDEECDCTPGGVGVPNLPEEMPEEMGDDCFECGAPPDAPHDPGCPHAEQMGPDPDRYREATDFDRFMDVTLIKEARSHGVDAKKPSPQRLLARNYQEHPLGKIRMGSR